MKNFDTSFTQFLIIANICYLTNSLFYKLSSIFRRYQVLYQIGVFISRSSVTLFTVKHIHIFPILQVKLTPPIPPLSRLANKQWYWKTAVRESYYIIKKRHMQDLKISGGIGGVDCTSTSSLFSYSTGRFSKIQPQFVLKLVKT